MIRWARRGRLACGIRGPDRPSGGRCAPRRRTGSAPARRHRCHLFDPSARRRRAPDIADGSSRHASEEERASDSTDALVRNQTRPLTHWPAVRTMHIQCNGDETGRRHVHDGHAGGDAAGGGREHDGQGRRRDAAGPLSAGRIQAEACGAAATPAAPSRDPAWQGRQARRGCRRCRADHPVRPPRRSRWILPS